MTIDTKSYGTHFFITSTLTFFMSTFWLNSAGNLVDFSSFASTLDAMMRELTSMVSCTTNIKDKCALLRLRVSSMFGYDALGFDVLFLRCPTLEASSSEDGVRNYPLREAKLSSA
jgi:hypothetical protein